MHRYEIIIIKSSRSGSAMKTGLKSRSCFSVLIEHDLRAKRAQRLSRGKAATYRPGPSPERMLLRITL
jgi:hypothetical protein